MLEVVSILPIDNSISIPLDQKITIVFNQEVDPFSIENGISLYTTSDGIWSGPDLAQLDTQYSDVLNVADDYYVVQYDYTIINNTISIIPKSNLLPDRKYYISVFPGNDTSRFISAKTVSAPIYTPATSGIVTIESSYIGTDNGDYILTITDTNVFDLSFGLTYIGSFAYNENEIIDLGNLKVSLSGQFTIGDTVTVSVFAASGVDTLYKTSFTTNKYTSQLPTSQLIDDANYVEEIELSVVNTTPIKNSVNNRICNPITIKFNKNIDISQDILDKVVIKSTGLLDGIIKQLNYKYKISGNILKLYLISGG